MAAEKCKALTAANDWGPEEQTTDKSPDSQADRFADQATDVIEGEEYARAYLARMGDGTAQPGELAVILAFLTGEMLHGACRLIEKALEGRRHA